MDLIIDFEPHEIDEIRRLQREGQDGVRRLLSRARNLRHPNASLGNRPATFGTGQYSRMYQYIHSLFQQRLAENPSLANNQNFQDLSFWFEQAIRINDNEGPSALFVRSFPRNAIRSAGGMITEEQLQIAFSSHTVLLQAQNSQISNF